MKSKTYVLRDQHIVDNCRADINSRYRAMAELPESAYDSLHKDYIQAVQEVRIAHENHHESVEQLQAEVERLKFVLNEYADYHQIISDEIGATDEYRAKIHQQKANELRNKAQGASK